MVDPTRNVLKIISIRNYEKWGYRLVKCLIEGVVYGSADFDVTSAFSLPYLQYIGNSKFAYKLWHKYGVRPQTIEDPKIKKAKKLSLPKKAKMMLSDANEVMNEYDWGVCSIGFSEIHQKWYGWSHRAIYGFGIGSEVKAGNIAFMPSNKQTFLKSVVDWHVCTENHRLVKYEETKDGVNLVVEFKYKDGNTMIQTNFEQYPDTWGRGEWTANTLEDAKQMAIDFAEGVA